MRQTTLSVGTRTWLLREPFVISRQIITAVATLEVTLRTSDGVEGRGASTGLDYAGETIATMTAALESMRVEIESGADRTALVRRLAPGGARAALDAALWDLEAKAGDGNPFERAGVKVDPVRSAITLAMRPPEAMAAAAAAALGADWLKLKVGAVEPVAVVAAARAAAPHARLIVDPNQAWSVAELRRFAPELAELGVELLEQPTPAGAEAELDGYYCPIPLCADEACETAEDLPRLAGRYAAINIKLDKTGGLTDALALADAAEAQGFKLMVGCMLAPSRAIAPAMVLAQRCAWVDLDGPPFLCRDDDHGFVFEHGLVRRPYRPELWG